MLLRIVFVESFAFIPTINNLSLQVVGVVWLGTQAVVEGTGAQFHAAFCKCILPGLALLSWRHNGLAVSSLSVCCCLRLLPHCVIEF